MKITKIVSFKCDFQTKETQEFLKSQITFQSFGKDTIKVIKVRFPFRIATFYKEK